MAEKVSNPDPVLSAGAVIVRRVGEQCVFLLLRVYRYWDFPKGEVEKGEDPFETALREVREETGLETLDFPWGKVYTETEPYGSARRRKVARYYLATTEDQHVALPVNPELERPEHDEYRWVTYQEATQLLGDRVRAVLDWAARRAGCLFGGATREGLKNSDLPPAQGCAGKIDRCKRLIL